MPSAVEDRLTYRRVPGEPLVELIAAGRVDEHDRARLARELGRFIGAVGALDPADIGLAVPLDHGGWDAWFDGMGRARRRRGAVARSRRPLTPCVASRRAPRPPQLPVDRLVFAHNDLGAEHVLVDPVSLADPRHHRLDRRRDGGPCRRRRSAVAGSGRPALPAILDGLAVDRSERAGDHRSSALVTPGCWRWRISPTRWPTGPTSCRSNRRH